RSSPNQEPMSRTDHGAAQTTTGPPPAARSRDDRGALPAPPPQNVSDALTCMVRDGCVPVTDPNCAPDAMFVLGSVQRTKLNGLTMSRPTSRRRVPPSGTRLLK